MPVPSEVALPTRLCDIFFTAHLARPSSVRKLSRSVLDAARTVRVNYNLLIARLDRPIGAKLKAQRFVRIYERRHFVTASNAPWPIIEIWRKRIPPSRFVLGGKRYAIIGVSGFTGLFPLTYVRKIGLPARSHLITPVGAPRKPIGCHIEYAALARLLDRIFTRNRPKGGKPMIGFAG